VQTPQPTQAPPSTPPTPPTPTGNTSGAQQSEVVTLQVGYTYSHTDIPFVEFFEDDEDTEHDINIDTNLLTDDG
jgi:hypothetical protein